MAGPLAGIHIIEFSGIGPGPFAAMLLADMGANVIRIDPVTQPYPKELKPIYETIMDRGRKRISVNLKHPEGINIIYKLLEKADVLIEGFRPGVMERFGLDPETCLSRNPGLIYGRVTGWGQEGPFAQKAGHDINYIALTGALDSIGRTSQPPTPPLNLLGDFGGGGMLLAFGVVSALVERTTSGKGQVIDAAMVDGAALLMMMIYGLHIGGHWKPVRGTNFLDTGAPFYEVYQCKDGKYVAVGAIEPKFYKNLVEVLGLRAEDLPDPTNPIHWEELKSRFAEVFKSKTQAEWCELTSKKDACIAPVLSIDDSPAHPHLKARNTFISIDGITQPHPAPRFSRTSPEVPRRPVKPGANTTQILLNSGYSLTEIQRLRKIKVIT